MAMGVAGSFDMDRAREVWRRISEEGASPTALAREYGVSVSTIKRYKTAGYAQEQLEVETWHAARAQDEAAAEKALALLQTEAIVNVGAAIMRAQMADVERKRGPHDEREDGTGLSAETYALVAPVLLRAIRLKGELGGWVSNGAAVLRPIEEYIAPPRPEWVEPEHGERELES